MILFSRRYEIMCHCWLHSPDDRPSFADLGARLDQLLDERTTEVKSNSKFLMAHQGSVLLRLFWQPPTGSILALAEFTILNFIELSLFFVLIVADRGRIS